MYRFSSSLFGRPLESPELLMVLDRRYSKRNEVLLLLRRTFPFLTGGAEEPDPLLDAGLNVDTLTVAGGGRRKPPEKESA
jgi:hypothetical protein